MYRFFLIKIWKKNNLDSYSNLIILSLLSLQNSWTSFWWLYFQSILQRHYFPINFVFLIRIHLEILFLISIFRSIHQKIEDHHIDEVIKYYWCISNHTKIKDEKKKLQFVCVFFASLSLQFVWHESLQNVGTAFVMSLFSLSRSLSLIFTFLPDWILLVTRASLSYWLFSPTYCHLKSNRSWCCYWSII
jgi:hypothetical protein